MAESLSLDALFESYGLYNELVLHLENISTIHPINEYLEFRREMKGRVLSRIVSLGVYEDEIPKCYFDYDRSSNSFKFESLMLNLHRECLYYCEKFSDGLYLQNALDYIAVGEFHRNRIVVIKNHWEDLFILDLIETGQSEVDARAQLSLVNAYVERLLASKKISEAS